TPADENALDPLAEQVTALLSLLEVMLANPTTPLSASERAVLDQALYATYARVGITRDPETHARPVPLLRDLHAILVSDDQVGTNETARGLASRLQRYVDGSLAGLFAGPTNVALDRPFVVFDVQ